MKLLYSWVEIRFAMKIIHIILFYTGKFEYTNWNITWKVDEIHNWYIWYLVPCQVVCLDIWWQWIIIQTSKEAIEDENDKKKE